jgi:choline dehydrogenase
MATSTSRYDVIVVGAGTAGSVIAGRLSEDSDTQVLLVEGGSAQPLDLMAVPPAWPALKGTSADWGDQTVQQGGHRSRDVLAPRARPGRVLVH